MFRLLARTWTLCSAWLLRGVLAVTLQVSISAIFAILVVPTLGAVIAFSYYSNLNSLQATSEKFIERASGDTEAMTSALLNPVAAVLQLLAATAGSNPAGFRAEESRNVLFAALTSSIQIDAIYTSFEDGYHRVVTRIDEDRRRSDAQIPPNAKLAFKLYRRQ